MPKTVLITGKPCRLASELVREMLAEGHAVIATAQATDVSSGEDGLDENLHYVRWNSRSPLSTRSVVMEAVNAYGGLDEAFLVYAPEGIYSPFHETSSATFEETVDRLVKSYLFMSKEVLSFFQRREGGSMNMVLHDATGEFAGPLDASLRGSFQSLADSLFVFYQNEPVVLRGFYSESDQNKEFARYIVSTVREKSARGGGKWHRYAARPRLFSFRS
jgi:NAD(P)-dependent dehydrogenase (short-subunit alcohol dehydrogenase family)